MAVSLGLSLAGPRVYDGNTVEDAYMFPEGRPEAMPDDIDRAVRLIWRAWWLLVAIGVLWFLLFDILL